MVSNTGIYKSVIEPITKEPHLALNFLMEKGIIQRSLKCLECNVQMIRLPQKGGFDGSIWRCHNKNCPKIRTTRNIRCGSPFEGLRASLTQLIQLVYFWSENYSIAKVRELTGLSKSSIMRFNSDLRSACVAYIQANPVKLGGKGVIVQADESLFAAKQKNHVGRVTPQIWVFGICEKDSVPIKTFLTVVTKRDAETLIPIIQDVVPIGSTIHTDEWPAYRRLSELGYKHETVCHKREFVNKKNGAHTQRIESKWGVTKARIKDMRGICKSHLPDYLCEFMWRDKFKGEEFYTMIGLLRKFTESQNTN